MMLGEQKFSEINMEDPESMNKVATFVMYKLFLPYPMGGFQQQDIINATEGVNRIYAPSPKGLAYWYMKNDHFYLKLDLPAIIIQVMKSQGKSIDQNLMALLTDAILNSDPVQLKNPHANGEERRTHLSVRNQRCIDSVHSFPPQSGTFDGRYSQFWSDAVRQLYHAAL